MTAGATRLAGATATRRTPATRKAAVAGLVGLTVVGAAFGPLLAPQHAYADPLEPDQTPPVITVTKQPGGVADWYPGNVNHRVHITDSHLGARGVGPTSYTMTGATTGSGAFPETHWRAFDFTAEGSTMVVVDAWDRADNHAQTTFWVGIDRTAPVINTTAEVRPGVRLSVGDQARLVYDCVDATSSNGFSGVAACEGELASGTLVDTTRPGLFNVRLTTRDQVGNSRTLDVPYEVVEHGFGVEHPTLTGTPAVGGMLVASEPVFTPQPTDVTYQWTRDGVPVTTADPFRYPITEADYQAVIRFTATATRQGYAAGVATVATPAVLPGQIVVNGPGRIDGRGAVGETLIAAIPEFAPEPSALDYQWFRGGRPIEDATGSLSVTTEADRGHELTVQVTGSRRGYVSASATSPGLRIPGPDDGPGEDPDQREVLAAGAPTIGGVTRVGGTLTATPPAFTPAATASYQWLRDGAPIAGATGASYRLGAVDVGRRIGVQVTGTAAGHRAVSVASAPTGAIAKARAKVKAKVKTRKGVRRLVVRVTGPDLAAAGLAADGKVVVRRGKKVVRKVTLRGGKATVKLPRLPRGKHRLKIRYAGSPAIAPATGKAVVRAR